MKNFRAGNKTRRRRKNDEEVEQCRIGPNTAQEIEAALASVRFAEGKSSALYEDEDFCGTRALNNVFENDDDIPWIRCKDLAMKVPV
jgi:hypothetical protein